MFPDEFSRPRYERELRRASEHRVINLGRWQLETLPPEVLEFRNLIGLSLGASDLVVEDGRIVREPRTLADDYWLKRPFHDLSSLTRFADLECLDLSCCRAITDLAPLKHFSRLKSLYLYGNKQLTDLSVLGSLTSLEELDASETGLSDYSILAGLPRLSKVIVFGSRKNVDLGSLAALPHLEELQIVGDGSWTDLAFLAGLAHLNRLSLRKLRSVTDWSPIASLTELRHLFILESPGLTAFAPLKPLLPQLESLHIREKLSDLPMKHQSEEDDSCHLMECLETVRKFFKPGRKKAVTTKSDVPSVPSSYFDGLRQSIRDHILTRLKSGDLPTTDDGLYALGVFVHAGAPSWVTLYHHTLEGLEGGAATLSAEDLADLGLTPADMDAADDAEISELSQRWSPAEWGTFDPIANEEINAIVEAYSLDKLNDTGRKNAFAELETRATAAAILALRDLDRENAFGPPADRDKLTLIAGSIDDEENPESVSLAVSVRFLNPEPIAARFLTDWSRLIGDVSRSLKDWVADAEASELYKHLASQSSVT